MRVQIGSVPHHGEPEQCCEQCCERERNLSLALALLLLASSPPDLLISYSSSRLGFRDLQNRIVQRTEPRENALV